MTRRRTLALVVAAGVVSCAYATWRAATDTSVPSPDAAHYYTMALHAARAWEKDDWRWLFVTAWTVVPNPVLVSLWMGLWMAIVGHSVPVAVASLLPFHVLAAAGLWRGGRALGGSAGGTWALVAGLGAPGVLAYGGQPLLDLPMAAAAAFAAGAMLDGRWGRAGVGLAAAALTKLAALPVLAWMAVEALWRGRARVLPGAAMVGLLYVPGIATLLAYAGESSGGTTTTLGERLAFHLQSGVTLAGPAIVAGVVLALLGRGDVVTLRVLGWAVGVLAGLVPLVFFAQVRYMLPAAFFLAIAGAGAAASVWGRRALGVLGMVAIVQGGAFSSEEWRPVALRGATGGYNLDPILDWLWVHAPPGPPARVALHLAGSDRLHFGLFAMRALERGLPLEIVVVDDHRPLETETDLAVVIAMPGRPTVREGWRSQLPPATETWDWPDGYQVQLWDRGLPPESLLSAGKAGEERNHPREQSLYAYFDGKEHGPLITHASSVEVFPHPHWFLHPDDGYTALFVRDQGIWRADSADGLTFGEARPLTDASGQPIRGFDPAYEYDGQDVWLFIAQVSGEDEQVDPATHATEIVVWRGPTLDALYREPGSVLEGVGLVDPEPVGLSQLYLTEGRDRIVRYTAKKGGYTPDPDFIRRGLTVPEPVRWWGLLGQAQVMGYSALYLTSRPDLFDPEPEDERIPLEICGTGASVVGDRLYYTRGPDDCPRPIVLPERRELLDRYLADDFVSFKDAVEFSRERHP